MNNRIENINRKTKYKWVMVDVEADGPIPGDYSMVSLGAVVVDDTLDKTFYGEFRPISDKWMPEALAISGFTREQTLNFSDAAIIVPYFIDWIDQFERPMFISDNNGFDWQFVNWYCWHFCGRNPFGHSSTNLGSLFKGMCKDMRASFKRLRKTKHTHHPVDDSVGNAEAFLHMKNKLGLKDFNR